MSISTEQLAELLVGIVRAQQAVIDAVDSLEGGWRNTHLLPKLNVAANMRLAQPRLIDYPSRVLLRSQSRVPLDAATVARDLQTILGTATAAAPAATASTTDAPAKPAGDLDFS